MIRIGFPPTIKKEIPSAGLTQRQVLTIVREAAWNMQWNVLYNSEEGLVARTSPSLNSNGEEIIIRTNTNENRICSYSLKEAIVDKGENSRNINAFIREFKSIKAKKDGFDLNRDYLKIAGYLQEGRDHLLEFPLSESEKIKQAFGFIIPSKSYFITPTIIILNVLIFLVMLLSGVDFLWPEVDDLIKFGASSKEITLQNQWWRILTCCFLHFGIFHLAMNMWVLQDIGRFLEAFLGRTKFVIAYLLSGIFSSSLSLWWHDFTISVGASGAIFGLFGTFLSLNATGIIDRMMNRNLQKKILLFIGFSLMIGFLVPVFDNAGHIGGLIGGILVGFAYLPEYINPQSKLKKFNIILPSILILSISGGILAFTSNWSVAYNEGMEVFQTNEEEALRYFDFPEEVTTAERISLLRNSSIPANEANIQLMEEVGDIQGLPTDLKKKAILLLEYSQLRKKQFELIAGSLEQKPGITREVLQEVEDQIESIKIALNPDSPGLYFDRAERKIEEGKYEEALSDMNIVIGMMPKQSKFYETRARIHKALFHFEQAVEDYEMAAKYGYDVRRAFLDIGYCWNRLRQFEKALEAYSKVISFDPTSASAYNGRGWTHFQLREYDKAFADYKMALELYPAYSTIYNNIGLIYQYKGNTDSATYYYNMAIEMDPAHDFPHQNLGRIESQKGNDAKALVHYNSAVAADEFNPDNYYLRAITLINLKKKEALDDIEMAISLNPRDPDFYRVRGLAWFELFGNYEKALKDYSYTISLAPKDIFAYLSRANFFTDAGKYEQAYQDYQIVMQLDSNYASAYGNSGWVKYLQGEYEACIELSKKAISLDSNAFYAMYNLALAELNLGHFEKSKSLYKQYRDKNIEVNGKVNSGAIEDLKDLIQKGVLQVEAETILNDIFNVQI
ncbi:rhomboid family intramembrane serine protease [Flexithrix dorotheae]|uniref:rhomboid family intramembrane serine protease n=1 Tax=Flexithrix dorotheae TaxID=70993 RepID=UPI00037747DA|nr:rhomboid family intramembrane serine protease [Flexithrix dorotheae]